MCAGSSRDVEAEGVNRLRHHAGLLRRVADDVKEHGLGPWLHPKVHARPADLQGPPRALVEGDVRVLRPDPEHARRVIAEEREERNGAAGHVLVGVVVEGADPDIGLQRRDHQLVEAFEGIGRHIRRPLRDDLHRHPVRFPPGVSRGLRVDLAGEAVRRVHLQIEVPRALERRVEVWGLKDQVHHGLDGLVAELLHDHATVLQGGVEARIPTAEVLVLEQVLLGLLHGQALVPLLATGPRNPADARALDERIDVGVRGPLTAIPRLPELLDGRCEQGLRLLAGHADELERHADVGLRLRGRLLVGVDLQTHPHARIRMHQVLLLPDLPRANRRDNVEGLAFRPGLPHHVPLGVELGHDLRGTDQVEMEGGDDAGEGAAAAALREPKEVRFVRLVGVHHGAVAEDDVHATKLVDRQARQPDQGSLAAAQGEAAEAHGGDRACGNGEAGLVQACVDLAEVHAAAQHRHLRGRVDGVVGQVVQVHQDAAAGAVGDVGAAPRLAGDRQARLVRASRRHLHILKVAREDHSRGLHLAGHPLVVQHPERGLLVGCRVGPPALHELHVLEVRPLPPGLDQPLGAGAKAGLEATLDLCAVR
mmetsp:Transcript_115648/g.332156  ORF Transcript_115648/g.332156 Transcript_115648/m.332156 type:complete len:593 (-) Transcript_115648:167-1945(-)